jgi:glucokinase
MESPSARRFVVVSGLPGSGKSTLARQLAPALNLPLIDKDDLLETLFEQKGIGDAAWRRALSRESDRMLQAQAESSNGAVLVSFWRLPGMPAESGTPTAWILKLSPDIVHVHCVCGVDTAADRFFRRKRHPGHIDSRSFEEVLASIHATERLGSLDIGRRVDIDTSREVSLERYLESIR